MTLQTTCDLTRSVAPPSIVTTRPPHPRTRSASFARAALGLAVCAVIALASSATFAQNDGDDTKKVNDAEQVARIATIVERYGGSLDRAWQGCRELEELEEAEDAVVDWCQNALVDGPLVHRLMAAKTLLSLGDPDKAERPLQAIAADDDAAKELRVAAIDLLADFNSPKTTKILESLLKGNESYDPELRVSAARALFISTSNTRLTRDSLIELLDVDNADVRIEAALALGEIGAMNPKMKRILRTLEKEPTAAGARARVLLLQDILMRRIEKLRAGGDSDEQGSAAQSRQIAKLERDLKLSRRKLEASQRDLEAMRESVANTKFTHPLFGELLDRIERMYVDPGLVDRTDLIIAAAKGMVASLDPFSSFMDADDTKRFEEGIQGQYIGIGAHVAKDKDSDYLLIAKPVYSGPAYKAGLLSDDRLIEVDGVATKGKSIDELIKVLQGEPGTAVTVKVMRRGWRAPKDIEVMRSEIHIDSVHSTMLPEKIGYISLAQFGDTSMAEIVLALTELQKQDMRGLILDLRNNPGGYLTKAVQVVDSFVGEEELPIVTQRDVGNRTKAKSYRATKGSAGDFPLVVLINGASASASEIVSGALQDFGRATIIGERSYGKGSVQQLMSMPDELNPTLGGTTTLRLTVQYYYLPSGRSIHTLRDRDGRITKEGGVEPDVVVAPEEVPLWRAEAISKLLDQGAFKSYLDAHFTPDHALLSKIAANGDGGSNRSYPEFDEHFTPLNTVHAESEDIRRELRLQLRRRLEDERGKEFACDFVDDTQLQRAIIELLTKCGTPADGIAAYRRFAHKFDKAEKEATAPR